MTDAAGVAHDALRTIGDLRTVHERTLHAPVMLRVCGDVILTLLEAQHVILLRLWFRGIMVDASCISNDPDRTPGSSATGTKECYE